MRRCFGLALALCAVARGLELFDDEDKIDILDKAGVYSDVFGTDAPVLLGAFSDDAEECPGCVPVRRR